ncbi:anti-sigma factor domain-containing protein [Nesterenkonia ebinurensis]|uniref:anti-sigma factor domain-containing protein n=1 Tax=Nesterenkonia ebinurensis TaxID=2608252 RepID=UPI00123CAB4A|nr:anti-sigma factor [Nesterenkonia ebinurensis]
MSETPRRDKQPPEQEPAPVAATPTEAEDEYQEIHYREDADTDYQDSYEEYPEDAVVDPETGEISAVDPATGEMKVIGTAPTLTDLLTQTAQGDQAAFSAFFEATSDVVYGLSLIMHAEYDDAHSSTIAVYRHLWDQADARARDLRLQTQASQLLTEEFIGAEAEGEGASYQPNEYELVLEWLIPLAHRIFVERFREGLTTPIPLTPVPQSEGGGVAGLPEEVLEDLLALSDSQAQALALTYLAGATHQQVAEKVEAAVPSVKSRLRDAMTRLHTQRETRDNEPDPILQAAVTKKDVERSGGVNRNFSHQIAADLDKGLLVELTELYALDAVDDAERALLDEKALTASESEAQQWETRVLAARRTLAEIFASDPVAPPSTLLEDLLTGLGGQEVGVGLVENLSNHTGETERRTPVIKKWMFVTGFLAIVLIGALIIWQVSIPRDIQALADADPEAEQIAEYPMEEGGTVDAVLSHTEDVGYAQFSDLPALEGEQTYQLWLLPAGTGEPSSIGNFTPDELEGEIITISNLASHQALLVTVENIRGEERPQGDIVAQLPLN